MKFEELPKPSAEEPEREAGGKQSRKGQGESGERGFERRPIVEIRKQVKDWGVNVRLKQGDQPVEALIDFGKKHLGVKVTPDGVRETIDWFLGEKEGGGKRTDQERAEDAFSKIGRKIHEAAERMRDKQAEDTVKDYAKQEGVEETEVIEDILDEMGKKESKTRTETHTEWAERMVKEVTMKIEEAENEDPKNAEWIEHLRGLLKFFEGEIGKDSFE